LIKKDLNIQGCNQELFFEEQSPTCIPVDIPHKNVLENIEKLPAHPIKFATFYSILAKFPTRGYKRYKKVFINSIFTSQHV